MVIKRQQDYEQIAKQVWTLVDKLPQRDLIAMSDARQWVGEVVDAHGDAAIWHAIRLNGFGGSEIGVLVRNYANVRADHGNSAHDIVASKLMRQAPTEDSGHLRRGHENEAMHAKWFYKKYSCARDERTYEILKSAQGKRPWMRYSPDDQVVMDLPQAGLTGLWLIDYKAPSQIDESDKVAFQYVCQLAQGAILCAENGIELSGMMLSQFDWKNWALKDDVVQWDPKIGGAVVKAGDHYWNEFVLKGQVPAYVTRPVLDGVDEFTKDHMDLAQQVASLAALSKAIDERSKAARLQLLTAMGDVRMGGNKLVFGVAAAPDLTVSAKKMMDREAAQKQFTPEQLDACLKPGKKVYDVDGLVAALLQLGGDPKLHQKLDLDADKVFAMGESIGLDPEVLVAEQLEVRAGKLYVQQAQAYVSMHFPPIKPSHAIEDEQGNAERVDHAQELEVAVASP